MFINLFLLVISRPVLLHPPHLWYFFSNYLVLTLAFQTLKSKIQPLPLMPRVQLLFHNFHHLLSHFRKQSLFMNEVLVALEFLQDMFLNFPWPNCVENLRPFHLFTTLNSQPVQSKVLLIPLMTKLVNLAQPLYLLLYHFGVVYFSQKSDHCRSGSKYWN